ncbi:MauE/DoxX family redox-associated membrane protein [Myroides odoratimimus]|uniref:MauE/DoxX family redox-associated membrane protein n=1 Tax=Myroides odoratimimus TaxID=76832 RepID=UPI002DC0217A|nr:MauE/DoxX family redox-associated membrane protein [Myroides odoratimimus]MEC4036809.1 MauE/DoxX family redox-associated membrane protein [Myroides odoratimimus]
MKAKYVLIVRYFVVLLFVYAAISKLITFEEFKVQLTQSPLLSMYAGVIAYLVVISELVIAFLLTLRSTKLLGLYLSYSLMVAFSIYIYLILNYSDFIPCSCGGVLEKLGWNEHLWFNIITSVLILLSIFYTDDKPKRFYLLSIVTTLVSILTVILLFVSSEHIIKKENPFIRRYLPHGVAEEDTLDLKVNTFFFSGYHKDKVYLGNSKSPLIFISVDSLMQREDYTIKIDSTQFKYTYLKLRTVYPYFYLADGSIPIVYKGQLNTTEKTKQTEIFSFKEAYFSDYNPIDSTSIVIKSQSSKDYKHILGLISINNKPRVSINSKLLESNSDGVFDTDGSFSYSKENKALIYTYYYKNQYVLTSSSLELLNRQNTIDTTKAALITAAKLASGEHKMTTPMSAINQKVVVKNNLLFIVSNSLGQKESKAIWKQASIVDIYDFKKDSYIASFYINHLGDDKLIDLIVTDHYIYGLFDQKLVRYRLAKSLTDKFE